MGIDRDRDTYPDFDELLAGSDPGNPASTPINVGVADRFARSPGIRAVSPNPFRLSIEVSFALARRERITSAVFDVLGRRVRGLARGEWREAGVQSLRWDGRRDDGANAGAGAYFVRLETGEGTWTRMLVKVK